MTVIAIALGAFGALIGSFLNVVVYRVPAGRSIVSPPSACGSCGHQVRGYDNIPVLSWLILRGKCRDCAAPISIRYPLVELAGAGAFAVVAFRFVPELAGTRGLPLAGGTIALVAYLYLASISIALALIDLDVHRLPNVIVLPAYAVGALLLGTSAILVGDLEALVRVGAGTAIVGGVYFLLALIRPGAMGMGDVKLAGVLGLFLGWLGWDVLAVGVIAGFILGGLVGVVLVLARRATGTTGIPFGPWMLAGAWLGILGGAPVAAAYLSLFTGGGTMSTIVGIDIGSTSIRAVEVSNPARNAVITRYAEQGLPDGAVRRGEVLEIATTTSAIKRLWASGKFTSKEVVLGMGGPRVLSRDLTVPRAPLAQIREALPFHVSDLLPVPVSEALLDFYPIAEGDSEQGPVVSGLLVAAIKDAVAANIAAVTGAGLRPVQVDLIPFALTRALAPARSSRGLVAVVSIGANTTNVVMVENGVPQLVRIVASGGDDINRALITQLQLSPMQAEQAKRDLGLTRSTVRPEHKPIADVIYSAGGDLVNAIRNTLTFYTTNKPTAGFERIILSGGGSQLIGLGRALSELTGIPVVAADVAAGAQFGRQRGADATREQKDALTTAYALALGWQK